VQDVEALTRLRLELLDEAGELEGGPEPAVLAASIRQYLAASLPAERFLAWVAEADGAIVATSGLVLLEKPPSAGNPNGLEAYLMNMYTVPGWRGRGLATRLLAEVIAYVKTTPARRLSLHCTEAGRCIYLRAGFVESGNEMRLAW
jgi:GNAT superfamily N-acetyltransferase